MTTISLSIIALILLVYLPKNDAIFANTISREHLNLKEQNSETHLSFYFHDVVSGPNPTVALVVNASALYTSPTSFGSLVMIDDPLTDGPENTSKLVGRAQGMYGSADQRVSTAIMVMSFVFLEGEYNGSTLSVLGRNQELEGVREMPVVGGTGVFRFAKGYAQARTHSLNKITGDAVVHYDVYVSHADSTVSRSTRSTPRNPAPALTGTSLSMATLFFLLVSSIVL